MFVFVFVGSVRGAKPLECLCLCLWGAILTLRVITVALRQSEGRSPWNVYVCVWAFAIDRYALPQSVENRRKSILRC
jgi:hypothetical protein